MEIVLSGGSFAIGVTRRRERAGLGQGEVNSGPAGVSAKDSVSLSWREGCDRGGGGRPGGALSDGTLGGFRSGASPSRPGRAVSARVL